MERPRVLLILPSSTYRAADFVEAGIRVGVEVVVGSNHRQTLEGAVEGSLLTLDFRQPRTAAAKVVRFARQFPLQAVVGVEDEGVFLAAIAAAGLGLPHNSPEAVLATRDKHRCREILRAAGVRGPAFRKVPAHIDPESIAGEVEYPCVLKPLFLSASRGVIRADSPAAFADAFRRIRALLNDPEVALKGGESARWILVETFIPGAEVAVEGLLSGGRFRLLALFDKPDPLVGPFFEETIYVTPSRLPTPQQVEIVRVTARCASALGLTEGPLHAEFRVNEEGVWPLEVAARSIGGLCSRTLRFGAGIGLEELILSHAVGRDVTGLTREASPAGVMMIPIPGRGILASFAGLEEAREVPGVEEVVQSIPAGQELVPLPEGSRDLGFLFARAGTPAAVEAALRQAHHCLRIEVASVPPG